MNNRPIGFFDSGVGGTSILKEVQKMLPNESCIYLADSKNAPYGEKSKDEILKLCIKNADLLVAKGCKLIVVACNTATTNAISYLRQNYQVPFIGIEPAIKPAAINSSSKTVGVLATKGTLTSSLFHSTSDHHAKEIRIIEQVGTGLVPLIEAGKVDSDQMRALLLGFVKPMIEEGIDYLVLGCTHYPYLIPVLREILPENVTIIDSGEAVARQTKAILKENDLMNQDAIEGSYHLFTNTSAIVLQTFVNDMKGTIKVTELDF